MKHSLPELPGHGPAIQLSQTSSRRTNMFGGRVIVSADLSLDRHASTVSVRASSFYWFCQLDESIAHWIFSQLRHMYMPSWCTCRLDYCNLVLAGWSKTVRVMNTGAPVLRSTPALSRWVTVARCGRLGHIQAQPNSVQVCSWPSTSHQTTCLSFVCWSPLCQSFSWSHRALPRLVCQPRTDSVMIYEIPTSTLQPINALWRHSYSSNIQCIKRIGDALRLCSVRLDVEIDINCEYLMFM